MMQRIQIKLTGAVQGVGFRPFIYNLANRLELKGHVTNDTHGLFVDVEGERETIDRFLTLIEEEKPPLAQIAGRSVQKIDSLIHYKRFEIRESCQEGEREVSVLPDFSTCRDCYAELTDPGNRRFLYPFINCTHCGPRFTLMESLPYDRPKTTMKSFEMCADCRHEYDDPTDRRFHAQPNACPVCGPRVLLFRNDGVKIDEGETALRQVVALLKEGGIVAIKGIGGFHIACDATQGESIRKLRERKGRAERPFAVMVRDIEMARCYADLTEEEEKVLISQERPITIVSMKENTGISPLVAPHLKKIGLFLPYSPLHFALLHQLKIPLVMTSANLSDEPIVKDNNEAFERLRDLGDFLLLHDREIRSHCDDSVVRVFSKNVTMIRRSRGYAPMSLRLPFKGSKRILAVGAHQKSVIALGLGDKAVPSQHIGDLETYEAREKFEEVIRRFLDLYDFEPELIVHDLHPGYHATKWAKSQACPTAGVQHHFAHALSVMADNELGEDEEVLAATWDGTGYGTDGHLWGGEFLLSRYDGFSRPWHLDPFKLLGGEKGVREPRRVALSLLFHLFGKNAKEVRLPCVDSFSENERGVLFTAWEKGINSPLCSSVGRLFDAVASLIDLKQILSFEGQSGMMMEDLYDPLIRDHYPYEIKGEAIRWQSILTAVIEERKNRSKTVSRFINTLARITIDLAKEIGKPLALTGGVFQNKPLVEKIAELAGEEKVRLYLHKRVPPNDGGLFLGQLVFGLR